MVSAISWERLMSVNKLFVIMGDMVNGVGLR